MKNGVPETVLHRIEVLEDCALMMADESSRLMSTDRELADMMYEECLMYNDRAGALMAEWSLEYHCEW